MVTFEVLFIGHVLAPMRVPGCELMGRGDPRVDQKHSVHAGQVFGAHAAALTDRIW